MATLIDAFQPEGGINLDDLVGIFSGTTDPRAGEAAPIGSLWIQSNGHLYQKVGDADTAWNIIAFGIGQTVSITSTDTSPGYLSQKILTTSSLTSTVQGAGSNESLLLDLATVGVPGTYRSVTTNSKGQVIAGSNPVTLSGYGIVDAQPLSTNLTALSLTGTHGLFVANGASSTTRSIVGVPNQIDVTSGDGLSGDPTLSLSSTLALPGSVGVVLPIGTTAARVDALGRVRLNSDTSALEYFNGTTWVSLVASTGGTVTSVGLSVTEGLSVVGSPITTSGTLSLQLANDVAAIEALSGTGFSARVGTDAWALRSLLGTAGRLSVTSGDGVAGNVSLDIDAAYVGQSSISTVGVITSGTWQGTTLSTQFGGTGRTTIGTGSQLLGVNTTATGLEYKSLIALSGISLNFSGGAITISNTGVTSITGTANQISASSAAGNITLSLPQSISSTSSPTFAQITVAADPTTASQVATKNYVDHVVQGLNVKTSVRAASTATVALTGLQTVDGVSLLEGDRVLLKNQTSAAENGIYIASAGAWVRAADLDVWSEAPAAFTFVQEGGTLQDTGWISTAVSGGTIDVTPMVWTQFSSAGIVSAGTGLTKVGNVLSITPIGAPGTYNSVTTNALGQVISGASHPYLTANQNITLQGDVSGGPAPNLLTTSLSLTGVTPGTYQSLTVDAKGRVTAGTNPTTLAEYHILDAQPLNSYLSSLSSLVSTGFVVNDAGIALARTIVAGSSLVQVTNGDGVVGNPTIDLNVSNIDLNALGGAPLNIAHGGTNLTTLGAASTLLSVNSAGTGLEYRALTADGITITYTDGGVHLATIQNGTVTSIDVVGSTGISALGSPITSAGTITLTLDAELQGLTTPTDVGVLTRTAIGTYAQRALVSGASTITITNPRGTVGNIGLDLALIGTAGTYTRVTTDNFGRVTSGTTPTTLSGYGIVDAQPLSTYLTNLDLTSAAGLVVKFGGSALARTIVAGSPRIAVTNGSGVTGNPTIDLGVVSLEDLSNVVSTAPVAGQALTWNGSTWVNASVRLKLYAENAVAESAPSATGTNAISIGSGSSAEAHDSVAIGPQAVARLPGIVHAQGRFGTSGDAQTGEYILRTSTINGTPNVEMFLDGVNGSERLVMRTDSTWVWEATIVAHRTDTSTEHAGFRLRGVLFCGGSLNSVVMLGAPSKEILARTNDTWNVTATANPVYGSLNLAVTGAAGQTIRWLAVVKTTEISN